MKDDQHDQPGIGHQPGDFADAADVLDPVGLGEAEIVVEAVADIVAVEQIGVPALGQQLLLDQIGDGRLAGAGKPGEPQHARASGPSAAARLALVTSSACQWMLWAPPQREMDHARADRGVGDAVDQDEAAELRHRLIGLEGDRLVERDVADARSR